jgi:hypothetical protein
MSFKVTNPVKDEVHPIVASQVTAKSHPTVASQEVSKVSEAIHPVTVNPSPTVAAPDTSNVAESISVEVKEVIFQELAVIEAAEASQVTNKSAPVVTFQVRVEVQLTDRAPAETELEVTVPNEASLEVIVSETIELEVMLVMFQVEAFIVSNVAETQVNVQSAVIFPINSTSPLIVCKVTLDKSKFISSITLSNAVLSREIL